MFTDSGVIQSEGIGIGLMSEWETKASLLICKHIENVDKVRFLQSDTEADIAAARIARAVTGREKNIRMGGAMNSYMIWARLRHSLFKAGLHSQPRHQTDHLDHSCSIYMFDCANSVPPGSLTDLA